MPESLIDARDARDRARVPDKQAVDIREPRVPRTYDCSKCPGFCCSYPIIEITERDIDRLARHFDIAPSLARARFTKTDHGMKRLLRRKADPLLGRVCRFLDTATRRCTVYSARPSTCRAYPDAPRCGFYDFLKFERAHHDDPEHVPPIDTSIWR